MVAPERRTFGPDAQARREKKAEREASWKEKVAEAMDFGKPRAPVRDVFDAGTELATAKANAAVDAGRPLRLNEQREVRRQVLEQQAGKSTRKRSSSIDEYLESLSERQRDEIELSPWFRGLDERHQANVRCRLAVLEEIEAEAEYEFQLWKEEQQLAADEEAEASEPWPEEDEPEDERESAWLMGLNPEGTSPEELEQARRDLQAANPEPDYSDNIEDGWEIEEEGDDE
jgi:hypothetical protein